MKKCLICQEASYELFDKQFDIPYYRCEVCGFIHMDRKYLVTFETERKVYDYHNNSIEDEGYVAMFERFIESFVHMIDGKMVLDYGSGPEPVFAELMKRRGFEVSIYDPHYYNDLTFMNKTFDAITSTEVFEHFKEPMVEMERLASIMKPGGILAVMTQFPQSDEHFLNWWYRRDETHISFYTVKSFQVIAERLGFELVYTNDKNYMILRKM